MARPANTDRLKRLNLELNRSIRWRNDSRRDDLWKRMVDLYRGKHYKSLSKEDRMIINMAFATKNVIAPSIAVNNPKFVVSARKPEHAAQAIISEEVLNYLWRTYKYQDEFRLAVDDFLVMGHGWIKVGYKATKPIEIKEARADDHGVDDYGVDDRDETVEGNVESEKRMIEDDDRPYIERISPFDIYVDPDARGPKDMKWIAQRIRRPLGDVRVDSRYDKKNRKAVSGTHMSRWSSEDARDGRDVIDDPDTSPYAYVDIWEFYDLRRNEVSTFAQNQEEGFLIAPKPIPFPFGHPFVMIRNYEIPDHFYPMGELESIEELQYELNNTRSQMMNHRKRFARKWLFDKEAFDADGIKALESDEDNTMVPVDTNGQMDIQKSVAPMPSIGTPPDFYNQSDLIQQDMDRISGTSDYMRGATAQIRRTATEAAMIQDAMNSRAADKLSRIESVLAQCGGRVMQLMQMYMTGEKVVRVVGAKAVPAWVNFDADYISGEFDYEVEAGSTQPMNESFRRQSALQMVDAMAPFVGQGIVNPQALARHVLQFGFGIKDPTMFMGQPQQEQPMHQMPDGTMMPGATHEEGMQMMQQQQGGMPEQPPQSPVEGIPPELMAAVQGASGFVPSSEIR